MKLVDPPTDPDPPPADVPRPQCEAVIGLQPRPVIKPSLIASLVIAFAVASAANAAADVITNWNNAALNAIRAANTSPPHASRALAISCPITSDTSPAFPRLPPKLPSAASMEGSTSGPQPRTDSVQESRSADGSTAM